MTKFIKVPNKVTDGTSNIYFPVEGATNYRSVTVATPYKKDAEGKPTNEPDISKKFFFFEFFAGVEVPQRVPITKMTKRGLNQKTFAVEEVVNVMQYAGAPISDPVAVATMETYLDSLSLGN